VRSGARCYRKSMTIYSVLWLVWIAMFGTVEGLAIARKGDKPGKEATLTHNVRWLIQGTGPWHNAARVVLLVLLAWLPVHFGLAPSSCL